MAPMPMLNDRVHGHHKNPRPEGSYHRDFTRIMYSPAFRRLQGKMQLLDVRSENFFRNRLTHSLEVAQIAESLTHNDDVKEWYYPEDPNERKRIGNPVFAIRAGALAHDIGNPPFGHAGERVLDQIYDDIGGFEGNAQSLRTLTRVEQKNAGSQGLNLTYRTLFSIVKYFKRRDDTTGMDKSLLTSHGGKEHCKKFIYDDDYKLLDDFLKNTGEPQEEVRVRTIDVQIIDRADEIAFAAHDLEDCLRLPVFDIDTYIQEFNLRKYDIEEEEEVKVRDKRIRDFKEAQNILSTIIDEAKKKANSRGEQYVSSFNYEHLFRQELTSLIIKTLINDVKMLPVTDKRFKQRTGTEQTEELQFGKFAELANGLYETTFKCVNNSHGVYAHEKRAEHLLWYLEWLYSAHPQLLTPPYRVDLVERQYDLSDLKEFYGQEEATFKKNYQKRLRCDYIAGMMDAYAIKTYEDYTGRSFANILDDVDIEKIKERIGNL